MLGERQRQENGAETPRLKPVKEREEGVRGRNEGSRKGDKAKGSRRGSGGTERSWRS